MNNSFILVPSDVQRVDNAAPMSQSLASSPQSIAGGDSSLHAVDIRKICGRFVIPSGLTGDRISVSFDVGANTFSVQSRYQASLHLREDLGGAVLEGISIKNCGLTFNSRQSARVTQEVIEQTDDIPYDRVEYKLDGADGTFVLHTSAASPIFLSKIGENYLQNLLPYRFDGQPLDWSTVSGWVIDDITFQKAKGTGAEIASSATEKYTEVFQGSISFRGHFEGRE